MDNIKQNFNFINILMNCDETFKISRKYDGWFPQTNNMYWMNQQEHMVLYFLAKADNGESVIDNIVRIFNRGALFWMAESLQSNGKFNETVDIENIICGKSNKKYNNWRERIKDIHNALDFSENVVLSDAEPILVKDKTAILLRYIVHYLSVLGNSISLKDKKVIMNILKNFKEGYGKFFDKVDEQTLKKLLVESVKCIAFDEELSNEICIFTIQLIKINLL